MTRMKMHISKVKLPFYPPCEVKCGLQNRVSTLVAAVTVCRANFEKSYLTQFWSELSRSYAQIEAPDV